MKRIYISSDINSSLSSILEALGLSVTPLPKEEALPKPVASHADMLIFSDGTNHVTSRKYYEKHKEIFDGTDILLTDEEFGNTYPKDILFNAFVYKDALYGRLESVSDAVRQMYQNHVCLRQGYAKCSTLLFGDNAVTADIGIARTLKNNGCNVLEISSGHIQLPGYDYGFIGGASAVHDGKIIFFGDVAAHPDYEKMLKFITTVGYEIISDTTFPLTDLGGAVII